MNIGLPIQLTLAVTKGLSKIVVDEEIDTMSLKTSLNTTSNRPVIYQIRVEGKLDEDWSSWFNGMRVELESETPPVTSLTGEVADQASLRGVLIRLWNLNLNLISVERMEE